MSRLSLISLNESNDLVVNTGASANDKNGDPLRTAFNKLKQSIDRAESNFVELYSHVSSDATNRLVNGTHVVSLGADGVLTMPDGLTIDNSVIGYSTSTTITDDVNSQTTTNASQIEIDANSVVITRKVTQVTDDGVSTATDEAGAMASIGNGTAYLKTYTEPDGPNNTEYAEVGTSGSFAYLESRQDDVGGYTLGGVVTSPGSVSITTHSTTDRTWLFDQEGNLTVPEASTITGTNDLIITSLVGNNSSGVFLNGNPLTGTAILFAHNNSIIRADNDGTAKDWNFDKSGTITTPLMLPTTFIAVLDDAHMINPIGFASGDPWWEFTVQFQVGQNGEVQTYMDQIFPIPTNPGYVSGFTFRFTEADHGIPGFTFDITLNDVVLPGGAGWTANVAVTQPPEYPSTVTTLGAIKLTSNNKSWILGTGGVLTLPAGGDIVDSTGVSVINVIDGGEA